MLVERMHADVHRFNEEIIELPVPQSPRVISGDRLDHCIRHLEEELVEFAEASQMNDLEGAADGLVDLVYVALGRLVEMGIAPGAAFEAVHRANMAKRRGAVSKRPSSLGYDAVKPEDWTPPDLRPVLEATYDDLCALRMHRARPEETARDRGPKILLLGHARHGKDTAAEIISGRYGLSFTSTSWFCADKIMYPLLAEKYGYRSVTECYEDRGNHRAEWYEAIRAFNHPDATALGRAIFQRNSIYCGLRSSTEFHALRNAGVFDVSIWVDASLRLPPEPKSSCTVEPWMADWVLDNNGDLEALRLNIEVLMGRLATRFMETAQC